MRTASDKFRTQEGSYLLQMMQKVADATKHSKIGTANKQHTI